MWEMQEIADHGVAKDGQSHKFLWFGGFLLLFFVLGDGWWVLIVWLKIVVMFVFEKFLVFEGGIISGMRWWWSALTWGSSDELGSLGFDDELDFSGFQQWTGFLWVSAWWVFATQWVKDVSEYMLLFLGMGFGKVWIFSRIWKLVSSKNGGLEK